MKKLLCFLLVGLFAACLTACSSNGSFSSEADNLPALENSAPDVTDDAPLSASDPSLSESSDPSFVESSTSKEEVSPDADVSPSLEEETSNEKSEEQNTFYVTAGGETFSATFADNSGAQALKELLAGGDITIEMRDYGGFEKVGPLGQSLPTENSQTTTRAGDIVLYQGDQIVMFYGPNSWSYTRLGKIDDLTGWEDALGSGDITVTFSLQRE